MPDPGRAAGGSSPAPATVLVVDDEPMIVRTTRALLENSGFLVATAGDGVSAIEIARRDPPAAILLDIMMPDVDGWETLARLREDERTRDIPVIVFTAREHAHGHRLARELGAAGYLQKPFELAELLACVRACTAPATATA